jgi:hypothetical protein
LFDPDSLPPLVQALLDAPRAWLTPAQFAQLVEQDESYVTDALCDLDVAGWLDISEGRDGPLVTFSYRAMVDLELEIIEHAHEFRWVRRRRGRPGPPLEGSPLDLVVDRDLGPADTAIYHEALMLLQARRQERRRRRGLPLRPEDAAYPTILLMGHGLWHWHERDKGKRPSRICRHCEVVRKRHRFLKPWCEHCGRNMRPAPRLDVCTGCKSRPISDSTLCLKCNRWGWDELTSKAQAAGKTEKQAS